MATRPRTLVHLLVVLPLVASPPRAALAGWSATGVPVCVADGAPGATRIIGDGGGGGFVAWTDKRAGTGKEDIYVQHLDASGERSPGWPVDGLRICGAFGRQNLDDMIPDGAGGALLVWEDFRDNIDSDLWAQRVHADGSVEWADDGIPVTSAAGVQRDAHLAPDGAGGMFCAWSDGRQVPATRRDVYASHVLGSGQLAAGWPLDGAVVTQSLLDDDAPALVPDGSGGLYVAWVHDAGAPDIASQHLDARGAIAAGWPANGWLMCTDPADQTGVALVPGPSGDALAVWRDTRSGIAYYAERFGPAPASAGGAWTSGGRELYGSANGKQAPLVATDGAGGAFVAWGELVSPTNEDLFALHVGGDASLVVSVQHPDGIVPMCGDTLYQDPSSFVPDGAGGAFLGWTDYRGGGAGGPASQAFVQHLGPAANLAAGWPPDGVQVVSGGVPQTLALPAPDGSGGALVAWLANSGAAADVYASRVGGDGVVPVLASILRADVVDGVVRVGWRLGGAVHRPVKLERSRDGVRWESLATLWPDGEGAVEFADPDVPAGTRAAYRLAADAGTTAAVWIEVPARVVLAIRAAAAQPFHGPGRVTCDLAPGRPATLTLFDAQGRALATWPLAPGAARRTIELSGPGVPRSGLGWLRLEQDGRRVSARVIRLD